MKFVLPVLGEFDKGISGSCSLNFCTAGGTHCSMHCPIRDVCYAYANENRFNRKALKLKLERHGKTDPVELVKQAIEEIKHRIKKNNIPPWFRFSTDGSLPMPKKATKEFISELRKLIRLLNKHDIPCHLPVETKEKARFYQKKLGKLIVVRRSCATRNKAFLNASGPVSTVVGTFEQDQVQRVEAARKLTKKRYELTGRKCIVCPAIIAGFNFTTATNKASARKRNKLPFEPPVKNLKAKCGNCKACVHKHMDIVYPLHK